MKRVEELEQYFDYLCGALGQADRNAGLMDYCQGLMLPIERNNVDPAKSSCPPVSIGPTARSRKSITPIGRPSRPAIAYSTSAPRTRCRIELEPLTGRSHQLRGHMEAMGHPILGDDFYDTHWHPAPRLSA